jgi:N utilization substance protein B
MGSRRSSRILALQGLYQLDIYGNPSDGDTSPPRVLSLEDVLSFSWVEKDYDFSTLEFARCLIAGTCEHLQEIDRVIVGQLEHWDLNRVSYIDRAILRFSTFSLLYQDDVPDSVIINEAVDIAKLFGTDDSYRFVNGVLDGIRKEKEHR